MANFKHDAVFKLYQNAKIVFSKEDGSVIAKDQNENEIEIDMTAVNTKATELENAKINLKDSAKQKLIDLGLTEDEANTIWQQ